MFSRFQGRGRVARALGLTALAVSLSGAVAASADSPQLTCDGHTATIIGTDSSETIIGTPGADVIYAGGGDDTVIAGSGADLVCGGPGDDRIAGRLGADRLLGEGGADRLLGGRTDDRVDGGPGDADLVSGDLGDDTVLGGDGDGDQVAGGLGIDTVDGGAGDGDVVSGDYGWDWMRGGAGEGDIASFSSAVSDGGRGVRVSLRRGRARGDGRDALGGFEGIEGSAFDDVLSGDRAANLIDGGPGDDTLRGGGGRDTAQGDTGTDRCIGFEARDSCGHADPIRAPAYVQVDPSPGGASGLTLLGLRGANNLSLTADAAEVSYSVHSSEALAVGPGCTRSGPDDAECQAVPPVRAILADLGAGDDRLRIDGAPSGLTGVRVGAGPGDDHVRGGPEGDLVEAGSGADVLAGGGGSDGLIGGSDGPDFLLGGRGGDLIAAGGACVGGALVGGGGRDNASFAETPAHPGVLFASLARGVAYIRAIHGCRPVRLDRSDEDLEGSFDYDVLVGDRRANSILGQPGVDRLYGGGGRDILDARDRERDAVIDCGGGGSVALRDPRDPAGRGCRPGRADSAVPVLPPRSP